ncbi:MAG TPA: heme-binding protein [Pyrinomonadaceae bacterium]|nr:heme-binding protein [Pyrinomonadaceae bacterium]
MLTAREARAIISAAEARANELKVAVNIAVLDRGAHLKAFLRMDGAVLGSIDVANRKARTAVLFEVNSETVWEYCKPGAPAPGLELSNDGLAPFAGGIPLKNSEGQLRGAVGVSGGSVAQDFEIAQAAVAAYINAVS